MQADERRALLDQLSQAKPALENTLMGVSEQQAAYRPDPEHWSILDCVEHMALTEAAMFKMISEQSQPLEPAGNGREERFLHHSTNRTRKFNAPEPMRPNGRFGSLSEAFQAFVDTRAETLHYVESIDGDLRDRKTVHPVAGEVSCRECLALMIGHPLRHMQQIRELQQNPGYPRAT